MNETVFPFLSVLTFAPLVGALVVALCPAVLDRTIKLVALAASGFSLLLAICIWTQFRPAAGLQFVEELSWIPSLHVTYHLGVDGLSIGMVLLTAIITPLAMLAHWKQDRQPKLFFILFLLLQTGMFGVF